MLGFSLIILATCIFIALFFLLFTKDIAKKVQVSGVIINLLLLLILTFGFFMGRPEFIDIVLVFLLLNLVGLIGFCLLYTSPSPRDQRGSRMPSSA